MQCGLPPWMNIQGDFAKQIKKALVHFGIEKQPLGIDVMELPMLRALEAEGIEVVDGQQALLDAREIKTPDRSEEHTSELQSLMRISYAVFCLKKKNKEVIM